jgi:hypothetical protein
MILIRRKATGELAAVESLAGYDRRSWESLGPIPEGVDPMLAVLEAGAIANNLDVARALRRIELKQLREAAELAGCDTAFGRIQTGPAAAAALNTYAMQAIAQGEAFVPIGFRMADNQVVMHDSRAIVAAHLAAARHSAACHARYDELRGELEAAGSLPAIAGVDFDQGWPGETAP